MAFNPKCAVKYKKIPGDSKKSTENFFIAHKLINGFGDILNIVDFRQASIWLKEKANLKGYFPNLLIYDINNGSKVAYDIPAFKKLDGIQKQIEEEKKKYGEQGRFFQVKNIFNSVIELETKLKTVNKTPNAIGNDKKIDDVLKKAGIEKDLRDQFLQLIKDNPRLKSLKLSDILSSYVKEFVKDSDKAYYKAIEEPVSKELEKILINYFDKFNIRKEELDNLKEKFGVDSVGVFDVLAKTIYYAKNRNLLTLPEEYGHVFVELLGSIGNKKADNPLFKYMFDNIESWDGYQRVFRDYKDKYITAEENIDIYKIKKEAIGQAIGIALVRNYKNNKAANKSLWDKIFDKNSDFWTKIQEVIDYLYSLLGDIDYVNINLEADKIAKDILSKNYSKLDRLKKDTSNYNLLSYSETIKNQNKKDGGLALSFMKWYSDLGNIITGSLAYRLQGTTYRPEIDALHDIDMIVPSDVHNITLDKSAYLSEEELQKDKIYRKLISEGNYKEAKKYKIQGNLRLDLDKMLENDYFKKIKEKYPDLDFLYTFYNQKANAYYITINAIWSKNQTLKNKFKSYSGSFNSRLENFTPEELDQIYLFDFFLRPEKSEDYITVEDTEYGLNLAHFNYSFYEKLNMMGRAKDAYDYQNWKYFDENNILAPDFNDRMVYFQIQQSEKEKPTEIKPGVEELFDSNPELANQVYEALGVGNTLISKVELQKKFADTYNIIYNNQTIGTIDIPSDLEGDTISIGDVNIKPEFRGKGLGVETYKAAMNIADKPLESFMATDEANKVWNSLIKQGLAKKTETGFLSIKNQITPQQKQQALQLYSQYLDTIFPDSQVKDIVYHGTRKYDVLGKEKPKFDKFDKSFIGKGQGLRSDDMAKGFYFGSYKIADRVGTRIIPAILNIEEENITTVRRNTEDFDTKGDVFLVFEPEQIHILGNKQDIEGFKEFVEKGEVEKKPRINYEKFINLKPSSKITKEEWKELTQEEQEVLMFQAENC
jgi:hypothetical protein